MIVKPAKSDVKVRDPNDPNKAHIPAEGKRVLDGDPYWLRRLRSGDVVIEPDPPAKADPPAKPKAAKE